MKLPDSKKQSWKHNKEPQKIYSKWTCEHRKFQRMDAQPWMKKCIVTVSFSESSNDIYLSVIYFDSYFC